MTDRIIILAEGSIESDGTHEQLLQENLLYRSMFDKQMTQNGTKESALP
jgi:ABC-type transport system involved in Fe-S cluster assembly fused permease/ATPase subunit